MLFAWLLVIPHAFVLFALVFASYFVLIFAWFGALFTAQTPEGAARFLAGVLRYQMRVSAYGSALATDGRWPEGIRKFLVGLIRWQVRVGAWFTLLAAPYPPFQLD